MLDGTESSRRAVDADALRGRLAELEATLSQDAKRIAELGNAERYLRSLLNSSLDMVISVDPDRRIAEFNKAAERGFGYTRAEVIGKPVDILYEKAGQGLIIHTATRDSGGFRGEILNKRKDGSTFIASVEASPVQDASGEFLGVMGISRDITHQREIEREIQRNHEAQSVINRLLLIAMEAGSLEDILQKSIEHLVSVPWLAFESKGCIFLTGEEPDVLELKAHCNMSRTLVSRCARVPFGRCLCGRAAVSGRIEFAGCLDERHEVTYRNMPPHGHYCVPVLSAGSVIGLVTLYVQHGHRRDAAEEAFLQLVANVLAGIIERKRSERATIESEEQFKAIFDNATVGILLTDVETRREVAGNGTICEMLGYGSEEIARLRAEDIHPPDAVSYVMAQFEKQAKGEQTRAQDIPIRRRDGSVFYADVSASPVKLRGRSYLLGVYRDVTQRKQTQERLALQRMLLDAMNRVFHEVLLCDTSDRLARRCLEIAQEITGSSCGFINESNQSGRLDCIALSGPGWDACGEPAWEPARHPHVTQMDGIRAGVIQEGQSIIINDAKSCSELGVFPQGHPPLTSFMGIPLRRADRAIGMIALANKQDGYTGADRRAVEALGTAFVEALDHKRAEELVRFQSEITTNMAEGVLLQRCADRTIVYTNRRSEEIFGYGPGELLGRPMSVIDCKEAPDYAERLAELINEISADGVWYGEMRCVKKSGSPFWCRAAVSTFSHPTFGQTWICLLEDVTERKRVEEQFRTLASSSPVGIYIAQDGKFAFTNPQFQRLTGYTEAELLAMRPGDLLPAEEVGKVRDSAVAMLKGLRRAPYEFRYLTKSGASRWCMETVSPFEHRGRRAALGNFIDITEHRDAEAELELRAEILDAATDSIFLHDLEGNFVYVNDSACRSRGYTREEMKRLKLQDLDAPESASLIGERTQEVVARGRATFEVMHRCKDGNLIPAEVHARLVETKNNKYILGVARDISERKRAEQEAAQRTQEVAALHNVLLAITHHLEFEELLQEIVTQIGEAVDSAYTSIVIMEPDGSMGMGAKAFRGIPSIPTMARSGGVTSRVAASGEPLIVNDVSGDADTNEALVNAGISSYAGLPIKSKGTTMGVLFVHSTRPNAFGYRLNLLMTFASQAGIAIENARLYREAAAAGALRESDRLKSELLTNVSHELRTPLATIKGFSSSLLRFFGKLPDNEKVDFIREIDLASDRLTELVENLLELSGLEAGGFPMRREPSDVVGILAAAASDMQKKTDRHTLVTMLPRNLPLVDVDPRRIRQVVDNLLDNAVKYTPRGGKILVRCEAEPDRLVVSVQDHGIGINPGELDSIFLRFYQVDKGLTTKASGAGIGLAICRHIVESHGGRIWAASQPGAGSTFFFTLPLDRHE